MTTFAEGDYVRAARHDGSRAGGKEAPIYRLAFALKYREVEDGSGRMEAYISDELERVVVVGHPPYRVGTRLPFDASVVLGEGLIKVPMPLKKVPPRSTRKARGR